MKWWRQPRIFVSYRRDDSAVHARALYEDLVDTFGEQQVFFDVEQIQFGDRFRDILDKRLDVCDVVVAVIGPQWLTIAGTDGRPRIASDEDFVRYEIATTLRTGKRLIPVLVDGAEVPTAAGLPTDLAGLVALNFLRLDDREIGEGTGELVDAIRGARAGRLLAESERRRRTRAVAVGVALALLFAAWISLFDFLTLDTKSASLTLWLADVVAPEPIAKDLQLVVIGPETETALDKTFVANPAARRDHARLIERLAQAGARTVAFDFFITAPSEADDAVLVKAIGNARAQGTSVVFGARDIGRDGLPAMVPALRNAVTNWAILCIGQRLGYASAVPLVSQRQGANAVGLALAAANAGGIKAATIVEGARKVVVFGASDGAAREYGYTEVEVIGLPQTWCPVVLPGDRVATALYRMAPLAGLQSDGHRLAYEDVFALDSETLRRRFQGKSVLVGVQMPNVDVFPVFRGWTNETRHGLELHAGATSALLRNAAIEPLGWMSHFAMMLAATLLGGTVRRWAPRGLSWPRRALLAVSVLAWIGFAVWLCVAHATLLNVTYVLGALGAGYWSAGRYGSRGRSRADERPA